MLIPAQCSSAHIAAIEKRPPERQQRAVSSRSNFPTDGFSGLLAAVGCAAQKCPQGVNSGRFGVERRMSAPLPFSDISLFGQRKRVIHLDTEIAHRAFDLCVTKQDLDSPQIASSPVYQGRLGAPERMGAKHGYVQPDACYPG